jgi:mRNA interferase YafQ
MKRDLKLAIKRGKDIKKLNVITDLLQAQKPLPEKHQNHKLSGKYINYWECHIEPDWLLIYLPVPRAICLIRTGTHADLFE